MALEAQDAVVRLRLEHAQKFRKEANEAAKGLEEIKTKTKELDKTAKVAETEKAGKQGFLAALASGAAVANIKSAADKLDNFSGKAKQAAVATQGLSLASGFMIFEGVKEAIKVKSALTTLITQTGTSMKELPALESFVKKGSTLEAPGELAKSLYPFQSVLHNTKKSIEGLTAAEKGMVIGHVSLEDASQSLISFMKSGGEATAGWNKEMGRMLSTVGLAKMRFQDLVATSDTGLFQTATAAHIPQAGILASLAAVSATGGPEYARKWSTLMRTALLKLVGPQKGEAKKGFRALGLEPEATLKEMESGGGAGFLAVLRQIKEHESVLGRGKWLGALKSIFGGSRGLSAILPLLNLLGTAEANFPKIAGYDIEKQFGYAKRTDPEVQLRELTAQFAKLKLQIGEVLLPVLKEMVGPLKSIVSGFNALPRPLKSSVGGLLILGAILSPAGYLIAGLAKFGALILRLLGIMTGAIVKPTATVIADVVNVVGKGGIPGGGGAGAGGRGKFFGAIGRYGLPVAAGALIAEGISREILGNHSSALTYGARDINSVSQFLGLGSVFGGVEGIHHVPTSHNKAGALIDVRNTGPLYAPRNPHEQAEFTRAVTGAIERANIHVHISGKDRKALGEDPQHNRGIERYQRARDGHR